MKDLFNFSVSLCPLLADHFMDPRQTFKVRGRHRSLRPGPQHFLSDKDPIAWPEATTFTCGQMQQD